MMKVCHVITGLETGGAELALCGLLEALREPENTVVALRGPSALSTRVADLAPLSHLDMNPGRATPADVLRLREVLRRNQPDVIHAWMYHANLVTSLAMTGLRTPVIWGIHHSLSDLASDKRKTRMVIRANAWLSRSPIRIRYVSALAAKQHAQFGFSARRALVIPNGYDTDRLKPDPAARARVRRELGIEAGALVIGMVARVHPTKDHDNFLEAAARFLPQHPGTVFVLVGEGASDDNPALLASIERLGLRPNVRLCGRRADVPALDAAFDIATLSSRGEAFPNALAEAMACGTPCVATDVGDAALIIGETGVVVPPRDAAALCRGWARLAALTSAERQALGSRARARIVERFARTAIAHRFVELYRELVTNPCADP
ncbi:MAG: Glycosyltransferase [Rhodanobacteraceae bacterium]|jgi:glycosyltransferase involved in cell wall biosynthesis|nr:MAG: Glycosyltransferase [Rhodanobacteraceae bacterium]